MDRFGFPVSQAVDANPMVAGGLELLLVIFAIVVTLAVITLGVVLLGRHRANRREEDLHQDLQEQRQDIERREHRISEREERLDTETRHLEHRAHELAEAESQLEIRRTELLDIEDDRRLTLERVAGLTAEDAKLQLVESIENDAKRAAAITARDIERLAHDEAETRAKKILSTVIQRLAS